MDGTGPFRPVPGVSYSPAPRTNTTEQDTSTLPREQTVTSAERSTETSIGSRRAPGQAPNALVEAERRRNRNNDQSGGVDRKIEIDPETRDVLLKVVDHNTGLVRWQIPAETMMNMRVYAERVAQVEVGGVEVEHDPAAVGHRVEHHALGAEVRAHLEVERAETLAEPTTG